MKIAQAKQRALQLFQKDHYQELFELLYDEVHEDYGPWCKENDNPIWGVALTIGDRSLEFQLPFGDREVSVSLTSFCWTFSQLGRRFLPTRLQAHQSRCRHDAGRSRDRLRT